MEIGALYELYLKYPHVITDSRQVRENSIFFSIRGNRFDGNRFAAEALNKGARYAVVDDPALAVNERYFLVRDCLASLQELSSYHRRQLDIPIIAITGSNGKTTTREIIADILSTQFIVKATKGNLNNHIGVPLTLLGIDISTDMGIVEMGANHSGEIALLCELARPDYGLITNIGQAHLEGFGDIEGVKKAKGELYGHLGENGGLIFCNGGDDVLTGMLEGVNTGVTYYGENKDSVCSGEVISSDPFLGLRLMLSDGQEMQITTGLVGNYNLDNILAAVAIGLHFRIRPDNILGTLQDWSTQNNRSQRIETDSNVLVMDAYNANPASMMAALDNFSLQDHPYKVIILGDMLELGNHSSDFHQEVLDYSLKIDCAEVFLVGPEFSALKVPGDIKTFPSVDELGRWLDRHPLSDSLVLLKGSRGIGLESLRDRL